MSFFKVDIYTPAGIVDKNIEANVITIPTSRGEITVLPEHTHLITELSTGVMTIKTNNGDRHFSITTGIAKILNDHVTILSSVSEKADVIDQERANRALVKAKEKLSGKDSLTDVELIKFRRKLERAEMRLKLAYLKNS